MSATEELRRLLDERGMDYRVSATGYSIDIGPYITAYANRSDTTLDVSLRQVTPEQAVAATLGRDNAERYVGLRQGKYWERTENSDYYCGGCGWKVTDHDSYCPECGGALHKAALGSCNCSNDCTNGERTRVDLPHFWTHDGTLHVELPKLPESISVRLSDQRDCEVRSARTWQFTRDSGTCHDKNGFDPDTGFECTVCGAMTDGYMVSTEDTGHYTQFNFCPNCGAKVVDE